MNQPLPDRVANAPELWTGNEYFYHSFWELSSDRSIGFGPAPIPGWAIRLYGKDEELTDEEADELNYVIRKMDAVWLEHATRSTNKAADRKKQA